MLPTRLMVLSISAVALAALAFVGTNAPQSPPTTPTAVVTSPKPSPTPVKVPAPTIAPRHEKLRPKPVDRGSVYVEVYNNSNIHGLAASIAAKAQGAGWNVVGADNWYGTIGASTVYYPSRLHRAAKMLARDLGIKRLRPAISPMRGDRLTVILTADYH